MRTFKMSAVFVIVVLAFQTFTFAAAEQPTEIAKNERIDQLGVNPRLNPMFEQAIKSIDDMVENRDCNKCPSNCKRGCYTLCRANGWCCDVCNPGPWWGK